MQSSTRLLYIELSSEEHRADHWNLTKYRVSTRLKQPGGLGALLLQTRTNNLHNQEQTTYYKQPTH